MKTILISLRFVPEKSLELAVIDRQTRLGHDSQMIRKAVLPVAGLGTRFLPATKTVPKELFPIVDIPLLLIIAEEAKRAGIEEIILINGRGKDAIEDFFDISYELEGRLKQEGKSMWLERVDALRSTMKFISIRQKEAKGLGHAVLTAAPVVGNEPFAVLLGDEIMRGPLLPTQQLCQHYEKAKVSAVTIMEVPLTDVSRYGIVRLKNSEGEIFEIQNVVEKPSSTDAPSRWALPGRYVFSSSIFKILEKTSPGKNGEIQLTDAMESLAKSEGLHGIPLKAERFDAGDKLGYVQANIVWGLDHPEVGPGLKAFIKKLAAQDL